MLMIINAIDKIINFCKLLIIKHDYITALKAQTQFDTKSVASKR